MKRIRLMTVILLACIILGACGAGEKTAFTGMQKENSASVKKTDVSIAQSWWNIHDGDVYHLNADGSGSHNEISLTYTLDADVLSVTEGVLPFRQDVFSWILPAHILGSFRKGRPAFM